MKNKLLLLSMTSLFGTSARAQLSDTVVFSKTDKETICQVLISDVRDYASSKEELKKLVSECVASGDLKITFAGLLSGKDGSTEKCTLDTDKDGKISAADCQD